MGELILAFITLTVLEIVLGIDNIVFISILVGIAMFSLLLKTTGAMMQLVLSAQATGALTKMGGQLMNVIAAKTAVKKVAQ